MKILRNHVLVAALLSAPLAVGCTPTDADSSEVEPDNAEPGAAAKSGDNEQAAAGEGDEDAGQDEHAEHEGHDDHANTGETEGLAGLTLNDGEKWPMDAHTREAVAGLNNIIADASIESAKDGKLLGEALNAQLKTLIRGCTMKGAPHDELHVFLEAFMPAVNELEAVESTQAAQAKLEELKSMLETYEQHFE